MVPQALSQERQPCRVQVVGGLVQQQQVRGRSEGDRQPYPVPLTDRQGRQDPIAVATGVQARQGDVNTAVCIPGVQPRGRLECGGIGVGRVIARGQRRGSHVEGLQSGPGWGGSLGNEVTDRAIALGGHVLFDQDEGTHPGHHSRVGFQDPRQYVEQGGLAPAVVADDRQSRPGGDGDVSPTQQRPVAECQVE